MKKICLRSTGVAASPPHQNVACVFSSCCRVRVFSSRCRVCVFSSRRCHISVVRLWAHEMKLMPRGLNRVERCSVSDQFVYFGLDRVLQFEHDKSSGWIFSVRSMQVEDPFLLFLQNWSLLFCIFFICFY